MLVVLAAAGTVRVATDGGGGGGAAGAVDSRSAPLLLPEPEPRGGPPARPDPSRGTPVRLTIPRLNVDAEVRPVELEGETLSPPEDVSVVGWWRGGAQPGDRRGTVVLTGHSWRGGDGVFDDLGELRPGDRLEVTTSAGLIEYAVGTVGTYTHAQLSAAAERLFSQESAPRAVVTTCADYRDGAYHGTTVVIASPARRGAAR